MRQGPLCRQPQDQRPADGINFTIRPARSWEWRELMVMAAGTGRGLDGTVTHQKGKDLLNGTDITSLNTA